MKKRRPPYRLRPPDDDPEFLAELRRDPLRPLTQAAGEYLRSVAPQGSDPTTGTPMIQVGGMARVLPALVEEAATTLGALRSLWRLLTADPAGVVSSSPGRIADDVLAAAGAGPIAMAARRVVSANLQGLELYEQDGQLYAPMVWLMDLHVECESLCERLEISVGELRATYAKQGWPWPGDAAGDEDGGAR